jgi:predicted dinucleotide-binding enzyme
MRIGVLGSGKMASALATRWVQNGHEAFIGGRSMSHAQELASSIGARSGSLQNAAVFGDVCLLAVRSEGLLSALDAAGGPHGTLQGKVIVDCGNAVNLSDFSQVRWDGRSLAEQVEHLAVGSQVVKAFNLCHADVWRMSPPQFDGRPLAVPICGSEEAKNVARELVSELDCLPVDVGDISQARHLEAMAILMIRLLISGAKSQTAFNLVSSGS